MKAALGMIPLISVAIMVVWGMTGVLGGWNYSWLAVFLGGIVMACLRVYEKSKQDSKDKEEPKKED